MGGNRGRRTTGIGRAWETDFYSYLAFRLLALASLRSSAICAARRTPAMNGSSSWVAAGRGASESNASSTDAQRQRTQPLDSRKGRGNTPLRTISSTVLSDISSSRASVERLTYAGGRSDSMRGHQSDEGRRVGSF